MYLHSDLNLTVIGSYADWLCQNGVNSVFGEIVLAHVRELFLFGIPNLYYLYFPPLYIQGVGVHVF